MFVDLLGPARGLAQALVEHLKTRGVLATGLYRLRFVAHLDVASEGMDRAASAVHEFLDLHRSALRADASRTYA